MPVRKLDRLALQKTEDWAGNNAAFTCPICAKVFIVSQLIHRGERNCQTAVNPQLDSLAVAETKARQPASSGDRR
jgi:hypothetical protein